MKETVENLSQESEVSYDTLIFSEDTMLDFSQVAAGVFTNIKQIDLSQGSHLLDNLSVEDVVSMSGSNELTILGDSVSSVNLIDSSDNWQNIGSDLIGGRDFTVYSNTYNSDTVTVYIEQDVNDAILP